MGFFEPPPPPPMPEPEPRPPVWHGPPENVLGAPVPLHVLLARTADVALMVGSVLAYPTGFELTLAIRRRRLDDAFDDPFGHHPFLRSRRGRGEVPPEVLRFGIQFSDGRKATTLGLQSPPRPDEELEGPVLVPHGGGGGGRSWDMDFWVWPLPPAGALAFVCEWPSENVALSRKEVDASLLLDAAANAEVLWENGETRPGGSWSAYASAD